MEATIKDVARAAGVSHATVSRALNGRSNVSSASRRRVEAAARALGYRVNTLARGLACNRTAALGLLLPITLNPFFAQVAQAIVREARQHHQAVILDMFDIEAHDNLEHLQLLRERRIDGALVAFDTFVPQGKQYVLELQRQGFPLVFMSAGLSSDPIYNRVAADDEAGGYLITRHLIDLGHRRIAIFLGDQDLEYAMAYRVRGYERALSEAGAGACPELIVTGADSPETIRQLTLTTMDTHRPTAIFGCNDHTAIIIQHTLLEAGYRVPQDVSVVGFDGIEMGAHIAPPLTTVAYPWRTIACASVAMLLELIETQANIQSANRTTACRQVLLPYELVVRKSSGPPLSEMGVG